MKKVCLLFSMTLFTLLFAGCGSKISIEEAKGKIEELVAKGVPEQEMSSIKLYLFQVETAKKTGNSGIFRIYQDSLTKALLEFEPRMVALLEESGPIIDSLKKVCDERIAPLKGLHLKEAQASMGKIDSLMKTAQPLMTRTRLEAFALELDTLVMMQKVADSLRNQFIGAWVMEHESPDRRYDVVERTEIHMRPNGNLFILERKRGKTSDSSREDWEFHSSGTWDLMGDVAHHFITKDKRVRQEFQNRDPQTGKWKKDTKPPYDSTVTNGSKDRYASYDVLKKDFKRFPLKGR